MKSKLVLLLILVFGTGCAVKNFSGWEDNGTIIINTGNKSVKVIGNVGIDGSQGITKNLSIEGDLFIQGYILSVVDQVLNASFLPSEDDKFNLGSLLKRWQNAYFSDTIYANKVRADWFNWTEISKYLSFDGSTLDFSEEELNETIDLRAGDGDANGSLWNITGSNVYPSDITANVGIGMSSPAGELDVKGVIRVTDPASARYFIEAFSSGGVGYIDSYDSTGNDYQDLMVRADDFIFKGEGTERFRITDTGNVGIGTASPGELLHVSGGNILLDNAQQIRMKDAGGTENNVLTLTSDVYADEFILGAGSGIDYLSLATSGT